jgi:hypothetical protein
MFIVLHHFTDLHDGRRQYKEGDTYPREGYMPSKERINELTGDKNRLCMPLIKLVADKAADDGNDHSDRQFTKRNHRRSNG